MRRSPSQWLLVAAVVGLICGPVAREARADDLGPLLIRTLREFGYTVSYPDLRGTYPGGFRATATATYSGQEYDFGMVSLTLGSLQQPSVVSFRVEAANRLGPQAEFHALTSNAPLTYNLDINTGLQDFTAIGSILFDTNIVINPLGFYDFDMYISNRGDFTSSGVITEEDGTLDFDVGPVNVSGNIFADALALLTQPLFAAAGQENPFTKFSGRATREAVLAETVNGLKDKVEAGEALSDKDMADLVDATVVAALFGLPLPDMSFLGQADLQGVRLEEGQADLMLAGTMPAPVPEPTPLILLASGAAVWVAARRRTKAA